MSIASYTELQSAAAGWLNRSDLTSLIPDFITLTEERMNRALRVRQMETALSSTAIANNAIALPDGTVAVKTLWIEGYEECPLSSVSYEFLLTKGTTGIPKYWAMQGDNLYFDGDGTVSGVLYQKIPALSSTEATNWLLEDHPSAYLFGTLSEAFNYNRNDKERDRWDARFQGVLNEIGGADMRDRLSGPLQARAR
jgi:hypothetical protein